MASKGSSYVLGISDAFQMTSDILLAAVAFILLVFFLATIMVFGSLVAIFLLKLLEVHGIVLDILHREFTHASHHAAMQAPKRTNSGCAGRASSLLSSRMVAELKTILQGANVSEGIPRGSGGVAGAARPNRNGQTAFSTFVRRRGSEEAQTDAARSSSLDSPNVQSARVALKYRDREFALGTAIRIDGGIVEMPTVMLNGRENCGPTKQVTYTSSSHYPDSEHNQRGDYLFSPSL